MQYPSGNLDVQVQDLGGVQLLQQSARLVRPHANFTDEDYKEMGRISRLVQGMPLGLVLAAGWYEVLSFREIADEIEKSLDFLEGSTYDVPVRQRSVRAAFEYSWRRLSKSDQVSFMKLSIFRGGFSRQAAHRVTGTELRALRRLIDKSFIILRRDGRYEIHELLRKYGVEHLAESGESASIQDAHSEYYLGVLTQWEADIKGRRQIDTLKAIENDLENIRSAWYRAVEKMNESVINRSVEALHLFFSFRNWYREGAKLLQIAMEKLEPAGEGYPSPAYRRVLSRLAWHQSLGTTNNIDLDSKLKFCLQLAEREQHQEETAFILLQLGCHNIFINRDPANALEYLNKSLKLFQILDDKFYIAMVLHWLGYCHGFVSGARLMISYTQQSLDLAKETGNGVLIPDNMRNLAMGELCTGNYAAAERCCKEALAIDSRIGVRMGTAESKTLLSLIHFFRGDLDASCELAEEAIEMSRAVGYQSPMANALAALSLSAAVKGDLRKSERLAKESLAGNPTNFGIILGNWSLAVTYASMRMSELAWQSLQRAMEHAGSLLSDTVVAWMLPVAALLLAQSTFPGIAVEIVSTIENHPLSPTWIEQWDDYKATIDSLRNERCGVAFNAAWERGKTIEIRDILEFLQTAEQVA
ncbi:MAG: tetratricopeptide repeat protein [Chloroflexi bacterium]|nr:MAG: tetratricopeptide repeat protein [Chloroflexota bacterium]